MSDAICLACNESPTWARGLCATCYASVRKAGRLDEFPRSLARNPAECVEDECDRKPLAKGLCGKHYQAARAAAKPSASRSRKWLESVAHECAFAGCTEVAYVADRCSRHRVRKANAPIRAEEFPVWMRVIRSRVIDETTGCWVSVFNCEKGGYTRMSVRRKRSFLHRLAYEQFIGPIPEGLQLDHLCNNPPCCNPWHLEPVTAAENKRRAVARASAAKVER